jgi:hypothetical protein
MQLAALHSRRHQLDSCSPILQLNTYKQKLLCIYCKYTSVTHLYTLYSICTVSVLCGNTLNLKGTVSIGEQQSVELYIHCAIVWVCSGKTATQCVF